MIISVRYVEIVILQVSYVAAVSLCLLFIFLKNFLASFAILLILLQRQNN